MVNSPTARPSRKFIILFAIFSSPLIGCIASSLLTGSMTQGLLVLWRPLDDPPSPAEKILDASFPSIAVRSIDGKTYQYEEDWSESSYLFPKGDWINVKYPDIDPEYADCDYVAPYAPDPPNGVRDFIQFGYCPEPIIDVRYAIIEDGSVWRWATPDGLRFFLQAILPCIVLSIFVVSIAFTLIARTYPEKD